MVSGGIGWCPVGVVCSGGSCSGGSVRGVEGIGILMCGSCMMLTKRIHKGTDAMGDRMNGTMFSAIWGVARMGLPACAARVPR